MKSFAFLLLFLLSFSPSLSLSQGIPRNMGLDHVGFVVPNAQEAVDFFVDVFDCDFDWEVRRPPLPNAGERGWDKIFDIHPLSHLPHCVMLKCGDSFLTQYLEIFQWNSPDQTMRPGGWGKFTDIGFSYVSFTVKDINAVWDHIRTMIENGKYPGLRFVSDPPMEFPLRGELCRSAFIITPFGLWIEITEWSISGPLGSVIAKQRSKEHLYTAYNQSLPDKCDSLADQRESHEETEVAVQEKQVTLLQDIDTPFLFLDMDAFDHNVSLLKERVDKANVSWRAVVKAHKSPRLADALVRAGAKGILTLTVSEAEEFFRHGFDDIMVACIVVADSKIDRLGKLSAQVKQLRLQVQDENNARKIAKAVAFYKGKVQLLIELNIGHNRTGVDSIEEAVKLASVILKLEKETDGAVSLIGITGYEGHTPVLPPDEKKKETHRCHTILADTKAAIEKKLNFKLQVVSGGGSSNYVYCLDEGVLTELQAGGAALLDSLYAEKAGLANQGHTIGSFIMTQVLNVSPRKDRAMGDAGFKTVGWHPFAGLPKVHGRDDIVVAGLSAEHLKLKSADPNKPLNLKPGDKLVLYAPYMDSLMHLHSRLIGVRKGEVVDEFPILSIRK